MTSQSKYSEQAIDYLINDLIITLEKHKAPVDLSLMALGNLVSNILHNNITGQVQREALAETFAQALKNSVKSH